jgi:hypothetical protein
MNNKAKSIRSFIGAKDYQQSIRFYQLLGFDLNAVSHNMSLVKVNDELAFYLQDAFVKDWVENTMIFMEVEELESYWEAINVLGLTDKFPEVKLSKIRQDTWGNEFFLHDPSGILWHIGVFK